MDGISSVRISSSIDPDVSNAMFDFPNNLSLTDVESRFSHAKTDIELSVVVAIRDSENVLPVEELYDDYRDELGKTGVAFEVIFILEGDHPEIKRDLLQLKEGSESRIRILRVARGHGHATVLNACFKHARGDAVLMLPAYHQIEPDTIPRLISELEGEDMVVVRRSPRVDGMLTRIQVRGFHAILRYALGFDFHDLGCSVRILRRQVWEALDIYGDQHRFLPVLASFYGFKVKEIEAPQTKNDTFQNHLSFGLYANRLLDLLSIFFLTRFTRKPLRFFGSTGLVIFSIGFLGTCYLTFQRLFMGVGLADRPALLLGVLLIVIGILFGAIGLIGEMIIFTSASNLKDYVVEEVV